jgi:hypothetical protein
MLFHSRLQAIEAREIWSKSNIKHMNNKQALEAAKKAQRDAAEAKRAAASAEKKASEAIRKARK